MSKQTISISIWFIAAVALIFAIIAVAIDARAQTPTPTPNCWTVDGQLVCIGPGPVAITATPTLTPIAPTPEPTATPVMIRPMNICAHPLWTCVRLPIIHTVGEATGGVR